MEISKILLAIEDRLDHYVRQMQVIVYNVKFK